MKCVLYILTFLGIMPNAAEGLFCEVFKLFCPPTTPPPSPDTPAPSLYPSSAPSLAPSPTPSRAPSSFPSTSSAPTSKLPTGPFVESGYSELIKIPQPATPTILEGSNRTNCPHLESGLMDFDTLVLTPGADVTLPSNTRVVLNSVVAAKFGIVTIPDSTELILGEQPGGVGMDMDGMIVLGKLTAGSDTCRIETPVTLTLHGTRPSDAVTNPPNPEVKGIRVQGGTISLHGKQYFRTWTRLAETVEPGGRVLMLQDAVNWEPNQEIVLVTTAIKDSREWHQNEQLTIEVVYSGLPSSVGGAVRVTTPVQYRHIANPNYQAEVGLLSRMIVIQGAAGDSEPTDPDPLTCTLARDNYGDLARPCTENSITGYGAHVFVHDGGVGMVEGVEFYRVGQTNLLGRYPMHFHLLGDCMDCYIRDSSIHRSYYRCVAIHGTNYTSVHANVAYDVTGYCYYLESGVEVNNTMSFNLAAHIHMISPDGPARPQSKGGQVIEPYYTQSDSLTLPADVAASGFYIPNTENNLIGNSASGGWAGFAFPNFREPIGAPFKGTNYRPSSALFLTNDGNTAHSTGWWWEKAPGFYFGGALFYDDMDVLTYNPGRDFDRQDQRETCAVNQCELGDCDGFCFQEHLLYTYISNAKTFLVSGSGFNSWSGRFDVVGYESHDNGLSIEAIVEGFWMDQILVVCRTGELIARPPSASMGKVRGDGFFWYDTNQEHIITNATFRNCGYRSSEYDQYDNNTDRGCGDSSDADKGCSERSTVWGFLVHSNENVPELMQATAGITFENSGRRFNLFDYRGTDLNSTVSGRIQNWYDADGSVTGFGEPSLIGSGLADCGSWWRVDDEVFNDTQGPLTFIKVNDGPERGMAHINVEWDPALTAAVPGMKCDNDGLPGVTCEAEGYMRHRGPRFTSDQGLPMTANGDTVGPVGGYGWLFEPFGGPPKNMKITLVEVDPDTPLLLSIPYPAGTTFTITANAAPFCSEDATYRCAANFTAVSSDALVRTSEGNTYHVSAEGVLTFRIVMVDDFQVGSPNFTKPTLADLNRYGSWFAINRFERNGVLLLKKSFFASLSVFSDCASADGVYCDSAGDKSTVDDVCPMGFDQVSYDKCCNMANSNDCVYADGTVA